MSKSPWKIMCRSGVCVVTLVSVLGMGLSEARAGVPLVTGSGTTEISNDSVSSIEAYGTAVVNVNPGAVAPGDVELDEAAVLSMTGGDLGLANTLVNLLGQSQAELLGGIVRGDVTVADDGMLVVGGSTLNSIVDVLGAGQMVVNGGTFHGAVSALDNGVVSLDLSSASSLGIGILDAGNHGSIAATQPATLGGAFELILDPGYNPAPGEGMELLTYPSAVGVFDSMNGAAHQLPGNMIMAPVYGETSFGLVAALPADFNLDGQVDVRDLSTWAVGFAKGTQFLQGDADLNGQVDVSDLSIWAVNFAATPTQGSIAMVTENAATAIPEPGTLGLLGLGMLAMSRRPRRKG